MGWEGIGTLIGKVSTFIPGRVEQIKNEKERLLNERSQILNKPADAKSADRLLAIGVRISQINATLGNKASDG